MAEIVNTKIHWNLLLIGFGPILQNDQTDGYVGHFWCTEGEGTRVLTGVVEGQD